MRKLCTLQLLSASKTESFSGLRKEELGSMVESVKKLAVAGEVVNVSRKVGELVEDIATVMILGKRKDDRYELKGLAEKVLNLIGAFNLGDYVPFLGALDLQVCLSFL